MKLALFLLSLTLSVLQGVQGRHKHSHHHHHGHHHHASPLSLWNGPPLMSSYQKMCLDTEWPTANPSFADGVDGKTPIGQTPGLFVLRSNVLAIVQRGDRPYQGSASFDENWNLLGETTPLTFDPIFFADAVTGKLLFSAGKGQFVMPNSVYEDNQGNIWTTDIGAHLVKRFPANKGMQEPDLVIGQELKPGKDKYQFAKPSDVEVAADGKSIFVCDWGNNRIVKYSIKKDASGKDVADYDFEFGTIGSGPGQFNLSESIAWVQDKNLICNTDNGENRFQCYDDKTAKYKFGFKPPEAQGTQVSDLFYIPTTEPNQFLMYLTTGPPFDPLTPNVIVYDIQGLLEGGEAKLLDMNNGKDPSDPNSTGMRYPTDLSVSLDGKLAFESEAVSPWTIYKFKQC